MQIGNLTRSKFCEHDLSLAALGKDTFETNVKSYDARIDYKNWNYDSEGNLQKNDLDK